MEVFFNVIIFVSLLLKYTYYIPDHIMAPITVTSWNMGCRWSSAGPYMHELMDKTQIMAVSEHALYPCELQKMNFVHPEFTALSKASHSLDDQLFGSIKGNGGCAILWRKNLSCNIRPLPVLGSDRMCAIELHLGNGMLCYIISVYMPHQGCQISDFQTELDILEDVITECSKKGAVLVIGDLNVHFGREHGPRGWGKTTNNAKKLLNCMNKLDMSVIDMWDCQGPSYTYTWAKGHSYLDHCVVSNDWSGIIGKCQVHQDVIQNVSDHLPISIELNLALLPTAAEHNLHRVAWHKLSKPEREVLYAEPLEEAVNSLLLEQGVDPEDILKERNTEDHNNIHIDIIVQRLVYNILAISSKLPQIKYNKALKPYWDHELTKLSKAEKQSKRDWVMAGRPTAESGSPEFRIYKDAKREFRKRQRQNTYNYEKNCMEELGKTQDMDQKFFWHVIRKHRRYTQSITPLINEEGNILTNHNDIREEWNIYYQQLYGNVETATYDDTFKEYVNSEVLHINDKVTCGQDLSGGPISVSESCKQINRMKLNKAAGWDQISAEYIKYSGNLCIATITWLMNIMIRREQVPQHYKRGFYVPIPKVDKDPI